MTEINQPKIRFKGHINDWEERKLGDVVGEIQSGNRLPKDSLTNGDVPYVVAQTKNNGVFKKIARGTLDYNGNPMKLFPRNSISFSIDNPEAIFYRNTEFYTSNIMRVIHEDHLTHEQYVFILENMKRFIRGYDWSRKFSGPVVSNLEYLQPSEAEQQKIGSFFKQLDETIALHQQKLEVTKQFKQTMLKKMFPKDGETTPEIRFKGFTEDWEECKLGDFLYEVSKRGNSDLEFITVREFDTILRPQSNQGYGNIVTDSKKLKAKIVLNGQFLIDLTSYSRGIYLSRLDGLTSNTYSVLELSEFGNLEFFTEFLKHPLFVSKLESLTPIGARQGKKIDQNSLLKSKFRMPHKEEQEVIGNYFKELDIQINSLEKKLFDMNLYKKTMLKKMFL